MLTSMPPTSKSLEGIRRHLVENVMCFIRAPPSEIVLPDLLIALLHDLGHIATVSVDALRGLPGAFIPRRAPVQV